MAQAECPLCGSSSHRFVFSERGHDLRQCETCELFFIDPYPDDQAQYETVSEYDYADLKIIDAERHYGASRLYFQRYLPTIERELAGARSVLDVGCGTGYLLEHLGTNPQLHRLGLELNARRAAFARAKAGCSVLETPIEQLPTDTRFDAILLINLFSHVPRIDQLLLAVRRLLTDQGKVLLKVGELSRDIKKYAVHDWSIPDHLHFLGLGTIDYLCQQFGFRKLVHDRVPLSTELFDPSTWRLQGRSRLRNALKRVAVSTPLALPAMARVYRAIHGDSCYSSFLSLQVDPAK